MAEQRPGAQDEGTRATFHLPLASAAEEKAIKKIIGFVESRQEKDSGIAGYTYSDPSAFFGRWWSAGQADWFSDKIVLLIVDFFIALPTPQVSLSEKIADIANAIRRFCAKYGRPQEALWAVGNRITRYV